MSKKDEKYLINQNFKVLRVGEYVEASEEDGEFILTKEVAYGFQIATLKEIANANGMIYKSRTKQKDLADDLMDHLKTLTLPKVNKMTETQIVEDIIAKGIEAGHDDDTMLVAIVNEGISFKAAGKLFKSVMESKGYRASTAKVAEESAKILSEAEFSPEVSDDVKSMVEHIISEISGATEKQAMAAIRKYAKANEITLPKAKTGAKNSSGGSGGINKKVAEFLLENRGASEEEISNHVSGLKDGITPGQLKKYVTVAIRMQNFAKAWSGEGN